VSFNCVINSLSDSHVHLQGYIDLISTEGWKK